MLICDKRRPRTRGDTNIRPPQGGRIKTAPPASGPRLGRSLAGGLHPQTPRAAPPGAPSRTGPLLPRSSSRRGSGHGCDGGGGGQPLAVVHARRLAPGGFRASGEISKAGPCRGTAGGFGGRAPRVGRRWATRPRRWAVRVQPLAAVPAVHGLGEVVHGRPGSGRSGSSEQSNRANILNCAQPTRAKPRQYWVSREPLYKKIGDPNCTTLCNLTTEMQSKQQFSTF